MLLLLPCGAFALFLAGDALIGIHLAARPATFLPLIFDSFFNLIATSPSIFTDENHLFLFVR